MAKAAAPTVLFCSPSAFKAVVVGLLLLLEILVSYVVPLLLKLYPVPSIFNLEVNVPIPASPRYLSGWATSVGL